jgi:hypothetical protein
MALAFASSAKASSPIPTVHRPENPAERRGFLLCCGNCANSVLPGFTNSTRGAARYEYARNNYLRPARSQDGKPCKYTRDEFSRRWRLGSSTAARMIPWTFLERL